MADIVISIREVPGQIHLQICGCLLQGVPDVDATFLRRG